MAPADLRNGAPTPKNWFSLPRAFWASVGPMKLTDLNREGGIGSNSLLLQLVDLRLLVDCGLHPKVPGRRGTPEIGRAHV